MTVPFLSMISTLIVIFVPLAIGEMLSRYSPSVLPGGGTKIFGSSRANFWRCQLLGDCDFDLAWS